MTDCFKLEERSRIMSRIRSSGNYTTELRFLRLMRAYKISGWRRRSKLPGRPDFVFTRHKVAVFIDGDFWHGNPKKFRIPKSNCDYWEQKITGNRKRDRQVNKELKRMGWRVLRIWESSLRDEEAIMARLQMLL
jgi:DNA mismatch endonuclease (patch repair protein)